MRAWWVVGLGGAMLYVLSVAAVAQAVHDMKICIENLKLLIMSRLRCVRVGSGLGQGYDQGLPWWFHTPRLEGGVAKIDRISILFVSKTIRVLVIYNIDACVWCANATGIITWGSE